MKKLEEFVNKIIQGDCLQVMAEIPDYSIDAVITDPPYAIALDTWDTPIDIGLFMNTVNRLLKPTGFLAFFGQMPTIVDWILGANKYFKYAEHISWVKRDISPAKRLARSHEEILIYRKNRASFYNTRGKYTDVKCEWLYSGIASIEGIKRHISDLRTGGSIRSKSFNANKIYRRYNASVKKYSRSPEYVNFTNVWSFLPQNQAVKDGQYHHPAIKPVRVLERLIEVLSETGMLVLDPFAGSGTTAVACINTKRRYIGIEKLEKYCKTSRERVKDASRQQVLNFEGGEA